MPAGRSYRNARVIIWGVVLAEHLDQGLKLIAACNRWLKG
jgi:hypothetical protein